MNKAELIRLSQKAGVPAAKTIFYSSIEDAVQKTEEMQFPLVIRPEFGKKWQREPLKTITNGEKLIKVNGKSELAQELQSITPYDQYLIIQEIMQGPDENLYYLVCHVDRKGELLGFFCGQKLRLRPIHYGSATYMRTCRVEELLLPARKLLQENQYHGPAGVEFKKDDRDGEYTIIEINTRYGLWDVIGKEVGIDIFSIGYNDLLGMQLKPTEPDDKRVYWWSLARDIPVSSQYRKEGLLSTRQWLATFLKKPYIPDIYWSEPAMMADLYVKKLVRKLNRTVGKA